MFEVDKTRRNSLKGNRDIKMILDCQEIFDSITKSIAIINRKGEILYKNQELENLISYIGNSKFHEIIKFILDLKYLKDGLNIKGLQKRLEDQYFQLDCYNYKDYVVIFIEDITRLVKLEEDSYQEGKISSFSKLIAELFHDMKGPISGLKAATQYLKENPSETDLIDEMLTDIGRIEKFLRDISDLTRPLNLSLRKENIHKIVEKVINRFCIKYPDLKIIRNYDPSIPDINIDDDYMQTVFENILQNAVDAVGTEVTVWIETGISSDPVYSPRMDKIFIRIRDSGRGIPEEILEKIFLPFFSTKEKGTGVGLANAFKIVKQHGGVLRYIGNSTFEILLPIR